MTDPEQQHVAMSVRSLRASVDDLVTLVEHISASDHTELEMLRFDLEQLLLKVRFPILQREADANANA